MVKLSQKIKQIYLKVDSIAKKGKDGYLDYAMYLDELVSQSEWSLFEDMMLTKYQIDTRQYKSVDQVKSKTFEKIRFYTLDDFQEELKKLYNEEGVYQNGFNVYKTSNNDLLGQIYETEIVTENYPFYKDTELAVKEKVIIINLEVHKPNGSIYNLDTEDSLLEKYKQALVILTT